VGKVNVNQIMITPLKRIHMAEGDVLHGIKRSDSGYVGFGEAYFSIVENGAIKAWKRHLLMTLNLIVPIGSVKIIFMDELGDFREEIIGEERYSRITVPPGLWFGLQGLKAPYSLLMNVADIPHEPSEVERRNIDEVNFDWRSSK